VIELDWLSPTPTMLVATDEQGVRWSIKSSTGVSEIGRSVRIDNYRKLAQRIFPIDDINGYSEAYQRHQHEMGIGTGDFAYAENIVEAKQLIARIQAGDADLPPVLEQLEAAGFVQKYPDPKQNLLAIYSREMKGGSLDISYYDEPGRRSLHTMYAGSGAASWHNVCQVASETTGANNETIIYFARLPNIQDIARVGAAHTISVMEQRLARTGKERFSTPLGGALKRIRYK
jgi:hypothetical protein